MNFCKFYIFSPFSEFFKVIHRVFGSGAIGFGCTSQVRGGAASGGVMFVAGGCQEGLFGC